MSSVSTLHIDYETRSLCDLRKYGSWRYAADPSTEILLCAVALNDSEPVIWDRYATAEANCPAYRILELAEDPSTLLYAHNVGFEIPITLELFEKTFKLAPPQLHQWRCSAAMCRRMAYPHSLENASEYLELKTKKDKTGAILLKIFSMPLTAKLSKAPQFPGPHTEGLVTVNGQKVTYAAAWEMFRQYCLTDVKTEQGIAKHPMVPHLKGDVLEAFLFDIRLNARGIPVNVDGLTKAKKLLDDYTEQVTSEFRGITGLNPTQRDKVLAWLQERGYRGRNMQAFTMAAQLQLDSETLVEEEDSFFEDTDLPEFDRPAPVDHGDVRSPNYPLWYICDVPAHFVKGVAKPAEQGRRINAGTAAKPEKAYAIGDTTTFVISGKTRVQCKITGVETAVPGGMTKECQEALQRKALISYAVVKKIPVMLGAQVGGRVRGTFLWYGAIRTGRSSAKIVQPHNFKRTAEHLKGITREAYADICAGCDAGWLESIYGPPMEIIASSMRHFVHEPGREMLDADFKQIEARVLAWLSGHHELLQAFREDKDLYKQTASLMFNLPYDGVDKEKRFYGKVASLACIAEGELVLTDQGNIPIEQVQRKHKVWDGWEWVSHKGVIAKGKKWVMKYQGLRATPDHLVYPPGYMCCHNLELMARDRIRLKKGRIGPTSHAVEQANTYDILNAGPRHRFTVSGVLVHNCGYGGGKDAFAAMGTIYNVHIEEKEAGKLVKLYREGNKPISQFWKDCGKAAKDAILNPGRTFDAGRHIKFTCTGGEATSVRMGKYEFDVEGFMLKSPAERATLAPPSVILKNSILQMILPSGRKLSYPQPGLALKFVNRVNDEGNPIQFWSDEISFHGQFSQSTKWGRVTTHGAVLAENGSQATAGDFLTHGVINAEKHGYNTFMVVHDQALAPYEPEKGQTAAAFATHLTLLPKWAPGFPLAADANVVPFYTKD